MKKGFVLVDIPDNCRCIRGDKNGCQFGGMVCMVNGKDVMKHVSNGTKPDCCPIKEFPDNKPLYSENGDRPLEWEFNVGWNACLSKIEEIIS